MSNWFRKGLADRGIDSRKQPISYDKALYYQRHRIENMFVKIKDFAQTLLLGNLHRSNCHLLALVNKS